jgi:hypothetical protein
MVNYFLSPNYPAHLSGVADITPENIELGIGFGRQISEPSIVIEGVVTAECSYESSAADQFFNKMRAYEAIRPGYQDPRSIEIHPDFLLTFLP